MSNLIDQGYYFLIIDNCSSKYISACQPFLLHLRQMQSSSVLVSARRLLPCYCLNNCKVRELKMEKQKEKIKRRRRSYRSERMTASIPPDEVWIPQEPPPKFRITDYFAKGTTMKQAAINKRNRNKTERRETRLRAEETYLRVRRDSSSSSAGPVRTLNCARSR